jgi:NAD(P)-dependent dehydrogenase (short-subunit alcohol dehydrogenase family)
LLIASGKLTPRTLAGQVAVVTGAGGGIGFEAARSLIWLGARVVLAEIDKLNGREAEERLLDEFGEGSAFFIHTDVGDERTVDRLKRQAISRFDRVDIVINNATLAPLGAVWETTLDKWDASYRVNLRGPVLLARAFIPGMLTRKRGVYVCVSSLGTAYMGAYEAIKAAQVHLANTLDAELQDSGVSAFTIGPGFVPTRTALDSIQRLAALMGKTREEMSAIVSAYQISVEAAGAGFAAAVTLAERYRGQEISSTQALIDAGIALPDKEVAASGVSLTADQYVRALELCRRVRSTLAEQSAGWKERSIFERQWLIRTFKSRAGMSVEQWLETLERLKAGLEAQDLATVISMHVPCGSLADYYGYLLDMAAGYIKDPLQREEQLAVVRGWQQDVEQLDAMLNPTR